MIKYPLDVSRPEVLLKTNIYIKKINDKRGHKMLNI